MSLLDDENDIMMDGLASTLLTDKVIESLGFKKYRQERFIEFPSSDTVAYSFKKIIKHKFLFWSKVKTIHIAPTFTGKQFAAIFLEPYNIYIRDIRRNARYRVDFWINDRFIKCQYIRTVKDLEECYFEYVKEKLI